MQQPRVTILTHESIVRFQSLLSARARSPHTVKAYGADLRMFLLDVGPEEPTVKMEEFDELGMAWLTKHRRILAPRTTSRRLTSLREFGKWAGWDTSYLESYDAPDGGDPIPHPIPEGMAGVRRLIAATDNERQRGMIALCGMVGLRMAETLAVEADDFEFQSPGITVPGFGNTPMLKVRGKGDVTRVVPVSEEAMQYLYLPIARSAGKGPIIPLQDRFARRRVTDLGVKAGLMRRIASHDLRATFATAVYDTTKDQRLVQMLLGHKSGRTTEGYIGVKVEAMRDAVNNL